MAVIKACHLIAQLVKNPPAMQETWVRPLGWEDPLEKEMATHSSVLAWRIQDYIVHGVTKSQTQLSDFFTFAYHIPHPAHKGIFSPSCLYLPSQPKSFVE